MNKQLLAALTFVAASAGIAHAATVPLTFSVTAADFPLPGQIPSPANPTIGTNLIGTASFVTFGSAAVTSNGGAGVTFTTYPPGIFAPASGMDISKFSFNGGADTFTGADSFVFSAPTQMGQTQTGTITITSGTGIFSGATGFVTTNGSSSRPAGPGQPTPVLFSGSGQITAPGLAAVPEPGTMLLFGMGLAGVIALRKTGWRRPHPWVADHNAAK